MTFVDSHGHLCNEYFPDDLNEVIFRAIQAGVTRIVLPCVSSQSIPDILSVAENHPQHVFPLIGVHPTEIPDDYEQELALLEPFLSDPRVVGIGEIGLDLYHSNERLAEQKIVFQRQMAWARECHLPVSLHIRNAYPEAIEIVRQFSASGVKGILHCFSGGIQEAQWAIKEGYLLGIGGVITFKNNKLQDIVREVGLENIVLETDAPFLAPVPHRGQRNESAFIPLIAQKVAEIFACSVEKVAEITTQNVLQLRS